MAVILLFSIAFVAQAQTSEATDDAAAEVLLDESITAEDLGVKDPAILPDSPFCVFKDFWRGVQIATFNKVKEANLRLQHANERKFRIKLPIIQSCQIL